MIAARKVGASDRALKEYVTNLSQTLAGMEVTARYDAEHRTGFLIQTASLKARWAF